MTKLVLLVTLEVHPDDVAAMTQACAAMAAATRQEPGCLHYAFGHDVEHPGRFVLSERWRDDAALAAHFTTPHMARFRGETRALRCERRAAVRYDVSAEADLT